MSSLDLMRCLGCGSEIGRRRGNQIILVGAGEDGKHTILIDLQPDATKGVTCTCFDCGNVNEIEYRKGEGGQK